MSISRRSIVVVVAAIALVVTIAVVTGIVMTQSSAPHPPAAGTVVVASDLSKATDAAARTAAGSAEHAAAEFLSEQPTAYWLTPEADPVEVVGERIAHLAAEARDQSARIAVVVYGLPGRDCGGYSAGGLEDDTYVEWTRVIGDALRDAADVSPIVILEPDSLSLAPECGNISSRARQLRGAIGELASEHTWIYVDGGHSNWLTLDEMADMIARVDAGGGIRGFATNVSNFNATADEIAYAHALARRFEGLHAIIDTSRNGAGSNGEWCNPSGRLVGEPGGTIGDEVVDTNLWIKPPGESDGLCNGGPAAGEWWPAGAIELTRNATRG